VERGARGGVGKELNARVTKELAVRVARVEKMARVAKEAKVAKVERGVKVMVEPKATVANNNNPDGLKVIATVVEHTDGCNAIVLLATTIGWRLWRQRR